MAVYLGNGDGTFRPGPTFMIQPPGYGIADVTLIDVNHDGNLDAVATLTQQSGYTFGPVAYAVFFGDGKGNLVFNANTLVPMQEGFENAVLADFNGDGKPDLLVPTENSSTGTYGLTDYLGNGNGTFTAGPVVYSGASASDTQILVGDLNGDGNEDLVTLNTGGGRGDPTATVYLGDGHGGFQQSDTVDLSIGPSVEDPYIEPADLALGDFTGDGNLDLAVSYNDFDSNPSVVNIYPGDGAGHFGAQSVTVGMNPFTLVSIPRRPVARRWDVRRDRSRAGRQQRPGDGRFRFVRKHSGPRQRYGLRQCPFDHHAGHCSRSWCRGIISNGSPNGDTIQYTPAPGFMATTASRIPLPTRTAWSQRQRLRLLSRASSLRRRSWPAPCGGELQPATHRKWWDRALHLQHHGRGLAIRSDALFHGPDQRPAHGPRHGQLHGHRRRCDWRHGF